MADEPKPKLSDAEIERYARHLVLPEIGGPGQQKLKAARVLVVGAGGLGSPVITYLAAAGIGTIGVVDDDVVSLSNLQRQIIHTTDRLGQHKVSSAAQAVAEFNPHCTVLPLAERLTQTNAEAIINSYDVVVDGSDNFATRYLLGDVCEALRKPLVCGALGRFDGSLTVFMPYLEGANGELLPRYRDLFPNAPAPGSVPNCAQAGILGAVAGVIGTLQAVEVLKLITGAGEPLIGRLLLYDGLACSFETMQYKRRP